VSRLTSRHGLDIVARADPRHRVSGGRFVMADLNGSLGSIEIGALVRFLCGLGKSGDLLISDGHWIGQLSLNNGRLTAAAFNQETGTSALEFIVLALGDADFEFSEGTPTQTPNLEGGDPQAYLERLVSTRRQSRIQLPRPTAVPYVLQQQPTSVADDELKLDRLTLYLLLDINGVHSVRDLAERHGILRTLRSLVTLAELGLIGFTERPAPEAPAPPRSPGEQTGARRPAMARRILGNELLRSVVVTGLLVVSIRTVVENFRVDGISMEPTFASGQALVINRAAYFHLGDRYLFGGPQRGDVVVFRAPPQPDADYIKRVIGLPGDAVLIRDGTVFVNGEPLNEPYIRFAADYIYPTDGIPLEIPEDSYFVLGDNRPDSFDSHTGWLVPTDHLIGRAWVRYWPPSDARMVEPGGGNTSAAAASQSASR